MTNRANKANCLIWTEMEKQKIKQDFDKIWLTQLCQKTIDNVKTKQYLPYFEHI